MHEIGIAGNVIEAALSAVPEGGTLTRVTDPTLLQCPRCNGNATVVSGSETLVTAVRYDEP